MAARAKKSDVYYIAQGVRTLLGALVQYERRLIQLQYGKGACSQFPTPKIPAEFPLPSQSSVQGATALFREGAERASIVFHGLRMGGLALASTFVPRVFASGQPVSDWSDAPTGPPRPKQSMPSSSKGGVEQSMDQKPDGKPSPDYKPKPRRNLSKDQPREAQHLSAFSRERAVPASRLGRMASFGSLGVGLGVGAAAEFLGRGLGLRQPSSVGSALGDSPFLTEANAERIVSTLCRVRGAALKLGQMLSIQDNTMIHPQLQEIFERVRYSADFMPVKQVEKVLRSELGADWRDKLKSFDDKPFAAASIGQVHKAVLFDGREVAMKIQYPGVARSISSDIDNLLTVLNMGNLLPKGLYAETFVGVARKELEDECDYLREAQASKKFKSLVSDTLDLHVPGVIDDLTTKQILTSEFVQGLPLDKCTNLDQETRDFIGWHLINLCLRELFEWRYMQSDPNWSNFFYDAYEGRIILLDFGATREYSKRFVDDYLRVIRAAADQDREAILRYSVKLGFLTGYENKIMNDAHVEAVMVLGNAFADDTSFDFGGQQMTQKIQELIPVMLKHRLSPPPPETYSIHRKLSGAFLLCAKLSSRIRCKPLFDRVYNNYSFDHVEH